MEKRPLGCSAPRRSRRRRSSLRHVLDLTRELEVRAAAFGYLDRVTAGGTRPIRWTALQEFTFAGERIHLASQQGIFKPASLDLPISIRTAPPRPDGTQPYADELDEHNFVRYRYRGTDINHRENQLLRAARDAGVPLIYLLGVAPGLYMAHGATVVDDDPSDLAFSVALTPVDSMAAGAPLDVQSISRVAQGHYMRLVRQRAAQAAFRVVVLDAYRRRCTICRLGHEELLDAAHIIPDATGGEAIVTNGLALCKIHHAAYDSNILGVRPDYVTEVRTDILEEIDGPMLRHGLQEVHGRAIQLPRSPQKRPDREKLERRYEAFRAAG